MSAIRNNALRERVEAVAEHLGWSMQRTLGRLRHLETLTAFQAATELAPMPDSFGREWEEDYRGPGESDAHLFAGDHLGILYLVDAQGPEPWGFMIQDLTLDHSRDIEVYHERFSNPWQALEEGLDTLSDLSGRDIKWSLNE